MIKDKNGENMMKKYFTLSYDDGVTQDIRFIDLLNKYGLKATFNLNSSLSGTYGMANPTVTHNRIPINEIRSIYQGHEVAVHTLTHHVLTYLDDSTILYQVEQDRLNLSECVGYDVVGMAYPGAPDKMPFYNEHVKKLVRENTKVQYARTIESSYAFDLPMDHYEFNPTIGHGEKKKMFELGEKFLNLKPEKNTLFCLWGHSYDLDTLGWEYIEDFFKMMSGKEDICYCTNKEALLNVRE